LSYFFNIFPSEDDFIALASQRFLTDRQARRTTDIFGIVRQMEDISGLSRAQILARIEADSATLRQYNNRYGAHKSYMTVQNAIYLIRRVRDVGLLQNSDARIGAWLRSMDREDLLGILVEKWRSKENWNESNRKWPDHITDSFKTSEVFRRAIAESVTIADEILASRDIDHQRLVMLNAIDYRTLTIEPVIAESDRLELQGRQVEFIPGPRLTFKVGQQVKASSFHVEEHSITNKIK
jgi:hypothetical protein